MLDQFLADVAQAVHEVRRLIRDHGTVTVPGPVEGVEWELSEREKPLRAVGAVLRLLADNARRSVIRDPLAANLCAAIDAVEAAFEALIDVGVYAKQSNCPPSEYTALLTAIKHAERYCLGAGTPTEVEPKSKRNPADWRARAYLFLAANPTATDADVAEHVGKHPSTLARNARYKADVFQLRAMAAIAPAAGFKKIDGEIEAVARPSRLVPGTCSECGEAIKISPGDAGALVLCSDCMKSLMQ